jgi:hypothetical protein
MTGWRLNRRAVLRGAGTVAIGLPWLEAMTGARVARAQSAPARRFISVYTPGGTVRDNWTPAGTETEFTFGSILEPLTALKQHVLVLSGINMTCAQGEQRQSGMVALLTGTEQASNAGFAQGPSIDQVLAPRLSLGQRLHSLELAIRWGTGFSRGVPHPLNIINYRDTPGFAPIAPKIDPSGIFKLLFGGPPDEPGNADALRWERSILDTVVERYKSLAGRLGQTDRQILEAHLEHIRQLERELAELPSGCSAPNFVDTSDYDPFAGLKSANDGSVRDPATDAAIPKVGRFMTDMLVMALACDITSVATLQWSDAEADHTFPWLGLNETYGYYQGDGGYKPDECAMISRWYSEQHAYLIERLAIARTASGSLLDECIVFFGSEVSYAPISAKHDMPFLLAGGGGGLKTGRFKTYSGAEHNALLVALLNLCGDARDQFGDPQYGRGALEGLV